MFVSLAFNQEVFLSFKQPTIPKYHRLKKTGDYFDCTVKLVLSKRGNKLQREKAERFATVSSSAKMKISKT